MKIIDKNKDYYDFYQNIYRDDTFTFDRRDSYPLSKQEFASNFYEETCSVFYQGHTKEGKKPQILLLQICHNFWLIELIITKSNNNFNRCTDYELQLLDSWEDHTSKRKLIELSQLKLKYWYTSTPIAERVRLGEYEIHRTFNSFRLWKDNAYEIRSIPILKDIGIPSIIDAFDIYQAIENYFSEEKTANERTEAVGTTNESKITSHGFDIKKSFRNN